jgi:membrane protease YdiL (CAAX protease family)
VEWSRSIVSPRSLRTPLSPARRGPAPLALGIYGAFTVITLAVAWALGRSPFTTEPGLTALGALGAPELVRHGASIAAGVLIAAVTVRATRSLVKRWSWVRALHADLRPSIHDAGDATLVVLGIASAVGEELFFRGLLAPALGVVLSSLAFGMLHQLRGRAGWVWTGWATLMGLVFGALFLATGSLLGPLVAHAAINVANLRFLRDTEVDPPKPRKLGGLYGRT